MRRDHPFLNVDPYRDLLEEIGALRGLSMQEMDRRVRAVCESAAEIAMSRVDRDAVFAYEDPVSPESRALWQRLRETMPSPWWRT